MEQKDKVQICKVVAQAILADGQLTDSEREFLDTLMNIYGLSGEEKNDVMARNIGDDPAELAAEITEYQSKNELMVELAKAIASDGELSSSEREFIKKIAEEIGVEESEIENLVEDALK